MTNDEAKFILGGYRPGGRDAADPLFGEALRQAQADPALGAWFAREQAHSAAVAAKLREIAPPTGLREAILAGGQVSGGAGRRRTFWPVFLAAAAVAVISAAAVFWPKAVAVPPTNLIELALADAAESEPHGGHGAAAMALNAALTDPTARLTAAGLPIDFAELERTGCRTMRLQGRPVLEVCFRREGRWFHCYIARRADFPVLAEGNRPQYVTKGRITGAVWAGSEYIIAVAGKAAPDMLQRLL